MNTSSVVWRRTTTHSTEYRITSPRLGQKNQVGPPPPTPTPRALSPSESQLSSSRRAERPGEAREPKSTHSLSADAPEMRQHSGVPPQFSRSQPLGPVEAFRGTAGRGLPLGRRVSWWWSLWQVEPAVGVPNGQVSFPVDLGASQSVPPSAPPLLMDWWMGQSDTVKMSQFSTPTQRNN